MSFVKSEKVKKMTYTRIEGCSHLRPMFRDHSDDQTRLPQANRRSDRITISYFYISSPPSCIVKGFGRNVGLI